MKEIIEPTPIRPKRNMPGPVVIWNLVRRCNLLCKHCYTNSYDKEFENELSTQEVFTVLDDLKANGVKVLILSGGEPLLRPDIFEISKRAKEMGFYVGLSTNGTKITSENIQNIREVAYDYVGISLDGIGKVHDHFRGKEGAFDQAMNGAQLCLAEGIKVGFRMCLTQYNFEDLPKMINLVDEQKIPKFYMSHLNYSGRGKANRKKEQFIFFSGSRNIFLKN
jgi:MoaA/NifB/PqqE/SkfB family radical SAM enzyme